MLQNIYINRGLTTVYAISHPYVGTSTSYLWAGKVVALMLRYRGEALPPSSSPTVSSTPPARNRHVAHPVNTGTTSSRAQSSVSSVSNLQVGLHTAPASQPAQQQNSTLSDATTWLIATCALLLALIIALYARALPIALPAPATVPPAVFTKQPVRASFAAPNTDAHSSFPAFQSPVFRLPSRSLNEPQTDALVGTRLIASGPLASSSFTSNSLASNSPVPAPAASASGAFLPVASKLRRTQLRPASPTSDEPQKIPVTVGGRPTGLLARYGNMPDA